MLKKKKGKKTSKTFRKIQKYTFNMFCHNTFGSISFDSCQILQFLIFLNILNLEKKKNWKRRKDTRLSNFFLYTCMYNRQWSARFSSYRQRYPVVIPLSVRINLLRILASRYIHMHRDKLFTMLNFITYLKVIEIRGGFFL